MQQQTPLKVMLVLDEGESSPYLDGGLFGEAYDCHLIDVKSLGVGTENCSGVLRKVAEQAPDVKIGCRVVSLGKPAICICFRRRTIHLP